MNLILLALYMPMVPDTGGKTGSQSATVVVRTLALVESFPKDVFKELKIAAAISLGLQVVLKWFQIPLIDIWHSTNGRSAGISTNYCLTIRLPAR